MFFAGRGWASQSSDLGKGVKDEFKLMASSSQSKCSRYLCVSHFRAGDSRKSWSCATSLAVIGSLESFVPGVVSFFYISTLPVPVIHTQGFVYRSKATRGRW